MTRPARMKTISFLVLPICFLTFEAEAAYYAIPGRAPYGVLAPQSVSSTEQCEAFAKESSDVAKRLGEWHDSCLKEQSRGHAAISRRKDSQCTYDACESYHRARESFGKDTAEEMKECMQMASQSRESMLKQIQSFPDLESAQRAILAGPYSVAKTKFRDALADLFRSELDPKLTKGSINVASTATRLASSITKLRAICTAQLSASATDCDKQILLSVEMMQKYAVAANRSDPAVGLLQRAMFERLNSVNRSTSRLMENLSSFKDSIPGIENDSDDGASLGR